VFPFPDGSFHVVTNAVSVDYLSRPREAPDPTWTYYLF